jgi:hypothetical protein
MDLCQGRSPSCRLPGVELTQDHSGSKTTPYLKPETNGWYNGAGFRIATEVLHAFLTLCACLHNSGYFLPQSKNTLARL